MIENTIQVRVHYADTDKMGFCYYANYLKWFEICRTSMLREIGLPYAEIELQGFAIPVLEAYCKYLKPAFYDELITLVSWFKEPPRATFKIVYDVRNEKKELLAEGYTLHSFIDSTARPVRPPRSFMKVVRPYFKSV